MKRFRGTKGLIIVAILVLMVVGYYYYLSNRDRATEENIDISAVQEILLQDLERNYPPSPKEVVKYYLEASKCMHNEKLSDEDITAMGEKMLLIYDDELALNKPKEEYLKDLKSEITAFQDGDYSIVNYSTSSSTDVDYFSVDGYSFARLYGTYYLRMGKKMKSLEQVFLLREDEDGHWKIYGFQPVEPQEEEQ